MGFDQARKKIPYGTKLEVSFTPHDLDLIRDHTFADPKLVAMGVVEDGRITVRLSLDDIEELLGYVAAEANHSKSRRLVKELDRLFDYLQKFLDTYDDQADLP